MKKIYTTPDVNITEIKSEQVIMISAVTGAKQSSFTSSNTINASQLDLFS